MGSTMIFLLVSSYTCSIMMARQEENGSCFGSGSSGHGGLGPSDANL